MNIFKSIALAALVFSSSSTLSAQDTITNVEGSEIRFSDIVDVQTTPVPNQYRSSTCWSYSTLSFLEAELYRLEEEPVNLSEMWIVRNTYLHKAGRYVRMHGHLNFAPGGAFHDVLYVAERYGLMPESSYPGLLPGEEKPIHSEMDKVLKAMVDAVVSNPNKKLSPVWHDAVAGVLDAYMGEAPEKVTVDGNELTPMEYYKSLPISEEDYIEVSSFNHVPFYKPFILEVPDNWLQSQVYNVPLNSFSSIVEHALENGYSVAWGADVSEPGFSHKHGLAIMMPKGLSKKEKEEAFKKTVEEEEVTQESRQAGYDNYQTQDDHAMHIVGMCKDQTGKRYYIVKNSWGTTNYCKGYLYVSEAYFNAKTVSIMLHKDALPKAVSKSLNLK